MNGPAKYGALIYSNDINELAQFYIDLFSMRVTRKTNSLVSLVIDDFNIVIHTPPSIMPESDVNSVKLFITVDNLENAKEKAIKLGGQAFDGVWSNPLFSVGNIADIDGNHIQIREFN
tara:strand:- start:98 stop:451 length:354 start_codon:yes stop_codon:yes gene_type:complete